MESQFGDFFLVCRSVFTCKVTGKTYKVKGNLSCYEANVVYLISCKLRKDQFVGSAYKNSFKPRFRYIRATLTQLRTDVMRLSPFQLNLQMWVIRKY